MRRLLVLLAVVVAVCAVAVFAATRGSTRPAIAIVAPAETVGAATPMEVVVTTPAGRLSSLRLAFEQNGTTTELYSLGSDPARSGVTITTDGNRVRLARPIGKASVPGMSAGAGRLVVTASRRVLFGLRQVSSEAHRDVQVRLDPPRVSVVSTHHYINLGGSEMVVYRVTPDDVLSGVRVGELEYPGYRASGAGIGGATPTDPALRVAFFALRYDQPLDAPIAVFARDAAGNSARAGFEYRTFPKPFKKSRIELTDAFLNRVVPAILAATQEVSPTGATIDQFLVINGELRRKNAETIRSFAAKTAPEMLWRGEVFYPYTNSAAEAAFADQRTYVYQGRDVDQQVHLGFDLASYANTPVLAANRGKVLHAGELGIYGNCVIVDHGLGVQSLYGHLSSIAVSPGAIVEKGEPLGKSGMTGLAGGDHLHFTMLVNGQMVNPVEWWDPHWIQDRILRKLTDASSGATP